MKLSDFIAVNSTKVNIVLFFNDVPITQNGTCMSFQELIRYQDYTIDHICFDSAYSDNYNNSGIQVCIYLADPLLKPLEQLSKALRNDSNN